jgi:hypothetical protein
MLECNRQQSNNTIISKLEKYLKNKEILNVLDCLLRKNYQQQFFTTDWFYFVNLATISSLYCVTSVSVFRSEYWTQLSGPQHVGYLVMEILNTKTSK